MSEINDNQALTNLREMIQSFSYEKIWPVSKPEHLTSNWDCTSLYKKSTFRGRVWQFIHWLAGTSDSSLRTTVNKTAKAVHLLIQTELNQQKSMIEKINDAGVLGSFWKNYSVNQMQTVLRQAVRYHSLINTIQWAKDNRTIHPSTVEEQNVEKAIKKLHVAIRLENIWQKFAPNVPLTILYRELQSTYPSSQEELEKQRDHLQQTTCGEYPKETGWSGNIPTYGKETKCPEELLYSPLIAVARQLANHELSKPARNTLSKLFQDLLEHSSNSNGQILLDLAVFLKNPTVMPVPTQLPNSVARAVTNANWVQKCSFMTTIDDSSILGCRRDWIKKQRFVQYSLPIFNSSTQNFEFEPSYTSEEYMQKRHIEKFYCYEKKQDGRESISVQEFAHEVSG